ncbi:MAG: 50S ribosomal protein L32e [Candidatus Heimdallarchaeota archaeon]
MTVDKRLLREREKIRKSRPKFRRQESWRYKRIRTGWRKPMGIDNTMRHHKRGWPKIVSVGYRGPKATRGLTRAGKIEVLVHNVAELEAIEIETQVARIASSVGVKKKVAITNRADELEVKIINRPEEALTFATISEISDELLLEEEDGKKKSDKKKSDRKKRPSSALSTKELDELEKIELELGSKPKPKKTTTTKKKPAATTKKSTTKKKTTTTKPKTTAKKSTSGTTSSKKSTSTKKATTTKK